MTRCSRFAAALTAVVLFAPAAQAQRRPARAAEPPRVSADSLRVRLFALADDSMGGRNTGSLGNQKAAEWVAAMFQRYGLQPAGENGTWFQTIPFIGTAPDLRTTIAAGGVTLAMGRDYLPIGRRATWRTTGLQAIYGGVMNDTTTWPASGAAAGKLVVFAVPAGTELRSLNRLFGMVLGGPAFGGSAGFALAILDDVPSDIVDQILQPTLGTDTTPPRQGLRGLFVTRAAAASLVGGSLDSARAGQTGPVLAGDVVFSRGPLEHPARNVVAILPGRDPALRGTYVSLTAHNDHVGFTRAPADHDSVYAWNHVMRPLGADSPGRKASSEEAARIQALRDSLRAAHPARPDSIFNGADDDGSGTVALTELARVLSAGPRPKRSILFVSHAAEEKGLLGSGWFTDHATVPMDSLIAEIDEDMIGRGAAQDIAGGGPAYLEVIGAKRLSPEFGDTLEAVNARQGLPFRFNYEFDVPGHPLQYYCRADHYSYARYGVPAVAFSRGEHADYHQVTDEAQYIDYADMARVAQMVADAARVLANMDHRPAVTGPHGDPHAPCRQ
jgi:hypothetical protein